MDAGKQHDGPQVDVEVEVEPEFEQDFPLQDAGLHIGVAEGAEQDGVHLSQFPQDGVGKKLPFLEETVAAQVLVDEVEVGSPRVGDRLQGLDGLRNDLGAGPVAGNDADIVSFHLDLLTVFFFSLFRFT